MVMVLYGLPSLPLWGFSSVLRVRPLLSVVKGGRWVCGCIFCDWDYGLPVRSESLWAVEERFKVMEIWFKVDGTQVRVSEVA